ncbi:hypothetical protein BC832DRAFT_593252 [Gaertneriomyces semiglobifer]|nr:hypothetical protein BC832DRAFT_593252 [Gaertneriomyces semiglobifer]
MDEGQNRMSFRDMVALKREQVHTTARPLTSRMSRVKSLPGLKVTDTDRDMRYGSMNALGGPRSKGLPPLRADEESVKPVIHAPHTLAPVNPRGLSGSLSRGLKSTKKTPLQHAEGVLGSLRRFAEADDRKRSPSHNVGEDAFRVAGVQATVERKRSEVKRGASVPNIMQSGRLRQSAVEDENDSTEESEFSHGRLSLSSVISDKSKDAGSQRSSKSKQMQKPKRPKRPKEKRDAPRWNGSTKVEAKNSASRLSVSALEMQQSDVAAVGGAAEEEAEGSDMSLTGSQEVAFEPAEEEIYLETQYPVTPYQLAIYTKVCPTRDELESSTASIYSGPPLYIHLRRSLSNIDIPIFAKAVKTVVCAYRVLRTRLYRNENIVDADVEGLLDTRSGNEIPNEEILEFTSDESQWMEKLEKLFVVKIDASGVEFVIATVVADELSCLFIAKEILGLYAQCHGLQASGASSSAVDEFIDAYRPKEQHDFIRFAHNSEMTGRNEQAHAFFRAQCIEVVRDTVDEHERKTLEAQLEKTQRERDAAQRRVESLRKRRIELEEDVQTWRQQRKNMEADNNDGEEVMTYLDAGSGEVIRVSKEVQAVLVRSILGDADGTVQTLLDKHEVPRDVQGRIGAEDLSLDTFAGMTEAQVTDIGLLSKDRRKILALIEYVRNRIRECIQEQSRLKLMLERRIAKANRDLEGTDTSLREAQAELYSKDDMCIRLDAILKPTSVERRINPLIIEPTAVESSSPSGFDFIPINISPQVVHTLRGFQKGWSNQRRRRGMASSSSGLSTASSSSAEVDADDPIWGSRTSARISSVKPTCLAALAVVLKHITGIDQYLIGVVNSFRRNGVLVGPLTDTIPLKVDFTRKGHHTFNALLGSVNKSLKSLRRFGQSYASTSLQSELQLSTIPIQFEFHSFQESEAWARADISADDLVRSPEKMHMSNPTNAPDLALVLVETRTSLIGGFRYNKSRYDVESMRKWTAKYEATLEGVDIGREISIASMISRFYQAIWQPTHLHSEVSMNPIQEETITQGS